MVGQFFPAESGTPSDSCHAGYIQRFPVVLNCLGGRGRKKFELAKAGMPSNVMFWQAPSGTQNLHVSAVIAPLHGIDDRATLKVTCTDTGVELLRIDSSGNKSPLKPDWRSGVKHRVDKKKIILKESHELWFSVNGSLGCDVDVTLANENYVRLRGALQYEWSGIHNCPEEPFGCAPCSEEADACRVGETAVCDGGFFVNCEREGKPSAQEITTVTASVAPATVIASTTTRTPHLPAAVAATHQAAPTTSLAPVLPLSPSTSVFRSSTSLPSSFTTSKLSYFPIMTTINMIPAVALRTTPPPTEANRWFPILGLLTLFMLCLCGTYRHYRKMERKSVVQPVLPRDDRSDISAVSRTPSVDADSPSSQHPISGGRLTYPVGYEPVDSEDFLFRESLSSRNMDHDPTGLRVLGNDGL
mmetsp:Transcript_69661/g.110472  ORF Transcript_69661/g.110472 Transcript_69661/m.110472 type:complete len:415 (+) Transcript_69661:1-1245(+)